MNSKLFQNVRKVAQSTILLLLFNILYLTAPFSANAASDFELDTTYTYIYNYPQAFLTVTEELELKVNNSRYYLPTGSEKIFTIPYDSSKDESGSEYQTIFQSVSVTSDAGVKVDFSLKKEQNSVSVRAIQPRNVTSSAPLTLKLTYNSQSLIAISGDVVDVYISALSEQFLQDSTSTAGLTTTYSYNTLVKIANFPKDQIRVSYPEKSVKTDGNYQVLELTTKERINNTVRLQLGELQYFKFRIEQDVPKTDDLIPTEISDIASFISTNIIKIPLPREYEETGQNVFISSISPAPRNIDRDTQGNLIASFEVPANDLAKIVIEGYITLDLTNNTALTDITLEQFFDKIEIANMEKYLGSDRYWEISAPIISEPAQENLTSAKTLKELIVKNYEYINTNLDYDYEKFESKINERPGAVAALQGAPAVCTEFADSLVALFRAQGVPARAAVGYANDPLLNDEIIISGEFGSDKIAHQWIQIWIPDYGWYSLDPTFGESNVKYYGADLDHMLWYTMKDYNDENIGSTKLYSADSLPGEFSAYRVFIASVTKASYDNSSASLLRISDITSEYQQNYSPIEYFLKTNIIGRALLISLPIVILVCTVSTITIILTRLIKRKSAQAAQANAFRSLN